MSEDPPNDPRLETWGTKLFHADHWLRLDAALAAEQFARLLEAEPNTAGNAGVVWLQASELFRSYTRSWQLAGAASRWDHDFRREGDQAAERAATLLGGEYSLLDPPWLNALLGGQAEEAVGDALAEIDAGAQPTALTLAARRLLAHYCCAAGEQRAGEILLTSIDPSAATPS